MRHCCQIRNNVSSYWQSKWMEIWVAKQNKQTKKQNALLKSISSTVWISLREKLIYSSSLFQCPAQCANFYFSSCFLFPQETYERFPNLGQIEAWDELASGEVEEGSTDCDDEDGCQASGDSQEKTRELHFLVSSNSVMIKHYITVWFITQLNKSAAFDFWVEYYSLLTHSL